MTGGEASHGLPADNLREKIWGLPAIAGAMGLCPAVASILLRSEQMAGMLDVRSGTFVVYADELAEWMRARAGGEGDRVVGLPAVAAMIGVSIPTLRAWIFDPANDVPVCRVGGRWWASRSALERWKAERRTRRQSKPDTGGVV